MSWLHESWRLLSRKFKSVGLLYLSGDAKEQRKLKWITACRLESLERRIHPSATSELAGVVAVQFSGENNAAQLLQVAAPVKQEQILVQETTPGASDFRAIAAGPNGSIVFSGEPTGMSDGIYRLGTTPGAFTLVSDQPADALAVDGLGDVVALRFGTNNGEPDPSQVTISSIAPGSVASGSGDDETLLYQDTVTGGGTYQAVAADQQGNVYFAGQPGAGTTDGIYQVTSPSTIKLIKAGHRDELVAENDGDLLAMQFGQDAYGNHAGGAAISQIAPASGAETPVYSDAAPGDYYQGLAADANGNVLFSGRPGAGMTNGIYRWNATAGTLDLLSAQPADQIAVSGSDLLALRIGEAAVGASPGVSGQFAEIGVQTPLETILSHDTLAAAGLQQCIAVGSDGSVAVSGNPAPGLGVGIYLRAAGSTSFQRISSTPADALANDPHGNVLAMRLGRDASGNPLGVTISSIPPDGGDGETLIYQDTGGIYESIAVDQHGNVYFAGQPSSAAFAGTADGIYRVTSTNSAILVKAGHADQLAADSEGDILAMQFGHDSYGHHVGGATVSSIAPASGAQTVLYNDTSRGDMYNSLAATSGGQILIAGQPGAGTTDGIYRLNANAGTLDLISGRHADQIGADLQGDIMLLRLGHAASVGAASTAAQLVEIAPQPAIETIALRNTFAGMGTLEDVVVGPDGRAVISGTPASGLQAGIYKLGAAPGSFQLISNQAADELAVDSEGDIFAMRFGHDAYGHVTGGASITEYSASGGGSTAIYSDTTATDHYQDLAVDQHGNVYIAGQPGSTAADGLYKLNGPSDPPTLVANGHADRLAIDAEGDILAMRFGHDSYGHNIGGAVISDISPGGGGGGAPDVIYNEPAPGGIFNDMAVGANGQVLFSGQPGPGTTDGVYALNAATGEVDLLLAAHADRLASMTAGVVAEGGYALTGTPGALSAVQTLATFTDPVGPAPVSQYSAQISWGDRATTSGEVRFNSATGVFSVSGSHMYANPGDFSVSVSITRAGSPETDVFSNALIAPISAVSQRAPDVVAVQNNSVVTFSDQTPLEAIPSATVLLNGAAVGNLSTAIALTPDGGEVFSGIAPLGGSPGIYRLTANGSLQLVSSQPAESLAVDNQGDVLALRFGTADAAVGASSVLSPQFYSQAGGTDADWVSAIYPVFTEAAGSTPDIDYFVGLLANGSTRTTIAAGFAASSQFYNIAGGTDQAWIDAAFNALLGRAATASDETYWEGKLSEGQSRLQVAEAMLTVNTTTLSSIAPGAGDVETVLFQDSGGTYEDLAIDPQGNVYLAGQPSAAGSADGVYKLAKSGSLSLVAAGHADKLAVDAEGDILAMRFGHDAYGNQAGGATVSEIAAGGGAPAVVYSDPAPSDSYSAVAAGPNGQILLSGNTSAAGGIYRLNPSTGALELLNLANGPFALDANGDIVAINTVGTSAVLLKSAPQFPIETVLLPKSVSGYQDAVAAPDGSVVVSGQPPGAANPGIYRLGATPGTLTQISDTPADELAIDSEGDIFAMRFAHDAYGHTGGASITEYSAAGGAATVVYNDTDTTDQYQDLAVDQHGNVYLAGQPGASAADGVYRVNGDGNALVLVAAGHADRLAIDTEGDILAMQFGHDAYGQNTGGAIAQIDASTGASQGIYSDNTAGDFYNDVAVDSAGRILFSGQPGPGAINGVYTLNPASGQLSLVNPIATNRIAAMPTSVVAQGGYSLGAKLGVSTGSQILATFTDPAGAGALANYSATIDWSDQSQPTDGTISFDPNAGAFTVGGSHTYSTLGSFPITVTIHRVGSPDATVTDQAEVSLPVTSGATFTATEGTTVSPTSLATFSDPIDGSYTALIDWGDGQASAGTIASAGASRTISGSHEYTLAGTQTITITLTDPNGNTATAQTTAIVADVPLVISTTSVSVSAGVTANVAVATFTDPGGALPLAHYSASIDWGDESGATAGTITGPDANGVFTISGSHLYAAAGAPTVSVTVHHDLTHEVTIIDAALVVGSVNYNSQGGAVAVKVVGGNLQIVAGATVASSTPLAAVSAVTVNGAGGVANDFTLDLSGGTFLVAGGITFNGGALPATPSNSLTILGGAFDTDVYRFTGAHDGSIQLGTGGQVVNYANLTPLVNTGTSTNAVFDLPDGTVAAMLEAGQTAGTVMLVSGNGSFETTTVMAPSGTLTVNSGKGSDTVTLSDDFYDAFSGKLVVQGAANVLPPHVTPASPFAATEGAMLTQTLAMFTDPNASGTPADYSATIDWGDHSSLSTVSGSAMTDAGGTFAIAAGHVYAEAGSYSVTVAVSNAANSTVSVITSASIADAPLTGGTTASATSGVEGVTPATLSGAAFTDANTLSSSGDFTIAAVNWGDGQTDATGLSISGSGGSYTVGGAHLYAEEGIHHFSISIKDAGGSTTTISGIANVSDAPLSGATGASATGGVEGVTPATLSGATFNDADTLSSSDDFTLTAVNWGDGQTGTIGLSISGSGGSYTVGGAHLYADEGIYTFHVTIKDSGGSTTTITGTANVADAPLNATGASIATTESATFSGAVATFNDADTLAPQTDYSATVDWGDHSSLSTVSGSQMTGDDGTWSVAASHVYELAGDYPVIVTVRDTGGQTAIATTTATVGPALSIGTGSTVNGTQATVFTATVAQFTHGDGNVPMSHFAATIDWGDGTATTGTVTESGTTYGVSGTHAYTQPGTFTVATTVSEGGASTVFNGKAQIVPTTNLQGAFGLVEDVYVIGSGTITISAANGVLANDAGPGQLTVTSGTIVGAEGGTFVFQTDGSFNYTPPSDFPGFDYVKYTAQDTAGDQGTTTVNVLSQPGGVIWKFYEQVLHRDPDYPGLQGWINDFLSGGKPGDIAAGFFESTELLNQIITGYYQQYLGRAPQGDDLDFWGRAWRVNGGPELIKAQFASSVEFNNLAEKQYGAYPDGWITALYERILNRSPESGALPFWEKQLADGTTEGQVTLEFFTSQEAEGNDVTGWFNEYLGRAPSETELTNYVNQMLAGANDRDIEQAITNLQEYSTNPPGSEAGTGVRLPDYLPQSTVAKNQAAIVATDTIFKESE